MQAFSSHDIFQTLYQQIMLLELKPGSTLRENALCEQFGVSRTPVRSVLQELRTSADTFSLAHTPVIPSPT